MAKRVVKKVIAPKTETISEVSALKTLPKVDLSKVFNGLKKINTSQILVVLLIIAAFLIGVLVTKVQYLEKNQGTAQAPTAQAPDQAQQGLQPGQKVDIKPGHLPFLGKADAKVTIVEFADYRCPFCEKFFTDTESQIVKDYVNTGKVKFYFRHFAFLGDASVVAANATECANEQGKFWEYHTYLYKNQPSESDTSMYVTDKLTNIAGTLGMNTGQFQSCLDSKKYDKNVSGDLSEGQAAGVSGTPTVFINGISVVGAQPYSAFKTIIDQELAK